MAENLPRALADFFNKWREDLSGCFVLDEIEGCVSVGVRERPRVGGIIYKAMVDAADGVAGGSSFTLAIAHRPFGSNTVVLDLVRESKAPFSSFAVIAEYAKILKSYGISEVYADSHGFGIFDDEWNRNGINVRKSEYTTVEKYLKALQIIRAHRACLLDDKTLKSQLMILEHRTGDKGSVSVECPRNALDDVAAADLRRTEMNDLILINPVNMSDRALRLVYWHNLSARSREPRFLNREPAYAAVVAASALRVAGSFGKCPDRASMQRLRASLSDDT
jgi:hypothetical protein